MIITIGTEKVFDKLQNSFSPIKGIYENPTGHITLNGDRMKASSPDQEQDMDDCLYHFYSTFHEWRF